MVVVQVIFLLVTRLRLGLTMFSFLILTALLLCSSLALTIPERQLPSGYAPRTAPCPRTPLVRPATGISAQETAYRHRRNAKAQPALKRWLAKTNPAFNTSKVPTVALTTSGGGYRSLLCGAGVIKGLDARDSNIGTSGLYQGLTYEAGLSGEWSRCENRKQHTELILYPGIGGAWLLSSLAGNNWPTISSLQAGLWTQAFQESLLLPEFLLAAVAYAEVTNDIVAKNNAGFPPTLTDPWGRLLSYQFLYGPDGGVMDTLSGITSESNFTLHNVPYPIITALGVKTFQGECLPGPNATTYELTPYEFGSFDAGVSAFTPSQYLGSSLSNGVPTAPGSCIVNYDNLGYALGTSSSLFNEVCVAPPSATNMTTGLTGALATIVLAAHQLSTRDEYAIYPNPFYHYPRSSLVASQKDLYLVDGGEALQNNPIFPMLQPSREIDVILVNDNSADANNFPNGSEILTTYVQSLNAGLTKMPVIPSVETFISQGLNKRPTFFGCNDANKATIIYIPNVNYTYPSNQPTAKLQYMPDETAGTCSFRHRFGTWEASTS